jgi:hypothetical protein
MSKPGLSKLKPFRKSVLFLMFFVFPPLILKWLPIENGKIIGLFYQAIFLFFVAALFFGAFTKTKRYFFMGWSLSMVILSIISYGSALHPELETWFDLGMVFVILSIVVGAIVSMVSEEKTDFFAYAAPILLERYFPTLLERAAKTVNDTNDGYSARPYPSAKRQYSKDEIVTFAEYLNKKLIAVSYIDNDRVILVFSNGMFQYIPFLKPNLQKVTYVSFDYEGNSSIYISKKDYRKYKEELTFDQLCHSFSDIVLKFFHYFCKGEYENIIEMLANEDNKKGGNK